MAALERLSRVGAKGLYLMPNCNNPTGAGDLRGASQEPRGVVAARAAFRSSRTTTARISGSARTPPPPALRALDGDVIYIGTFSKKLVPALRIGFIVCPRALRPVLVGDQARHRPRHVAPLAARARRVPRSRLPARSLEQDFARVPLAARRARAGARAAPAAGHEVAPSRAGPGALAAASGGARLGRVFDEALRRGVLVGPSALYEVEARPERGLRLTFCAEPSERLALGARRLGEASARDRPNNSAARAQRWSFKQFDGGCIMEKSTFTTKVGLAEMLKGGVIMDVVNAEQARIAEEAGAAAVMALERVPAQIRRRRRRRARERSRDDPGDPARGEHPGDGQVPHRPLHRSAHPRGARGRLRRRERGADARRRGVPHRQARVPTCRSCAAAAISARRCGASPKAPR